MYPDKNLQAGEKPDVLDEISSKVSKRETV